MKSTMQDIPLTLTALLRRGELFPRSEVVTCEGETSRRATFPEVAARIPRLAAALRELGVQPEDRVGTLCWNHQEHLEAYFAIPCMGAVLHTLNLRLPPQQLAQIVNHAEDRVIIVDASLAPLLAAIRPHIPSVQHVVVVGDGDVSGLGDVHRYEDLVQAAPATFDWPNIDERSAASMCYTTGTTGDPKGVAYSHRSIYLHSFAVWATFHITDVERVLTIVPMFHVNAWGVPYAAWMVGADLLLPARHMQPDALCAFMEREKPTFTGGVPTIFTAILAYAQANGRDVSYLKRAVGGGSAVPASLITAYREKLGIELIQAWGMTETSPIGTIALPPKGTSPGDEMQFRSKTGRPVPGVDLRIVDDSGAEVAHDGVAVGEIEVRGPWITGSYYKTDAPEKFHNGWLRTGDVGNIDALGYVQITDRSKDVIKSGGEWISSVELENLLMGHPSIADAAVVGVPDERWQERPLAAVVLKQGDSATPDDLREFLQDKVARWWLPERWAFVSELPKTSVGKQDKKLIRAMYAEGKIEVVQLAAAQRS
ncbi:MAG: long-chain fatty acid--CoA ligase [Candidatus Dormibacteraeota bacterium]|nr:long-chain fatty acid--CoA ligase [Candidatus Dormibacteraeota bacterium]MBV9524470.1 long-chain fatty acid--CoA ligase [Candidatus Dormibacteraeota bacterium]